MIQCTHCGKEVYVALHYQQTFKYCSKKCMGLATRKFGKKPCVTCGKEFEFVSSRSNEAKYCSRDCYHKAQSQKGTVDKTCPECGKNFKCSPSSNKAHCSVRCDRDHRMKDSAQPKTFSTVRNWMIARNMITKCFDCGYDTHPNILGVHHIDENKHNNSLENLVVLCPNCHSIRHNQHIPHVLKSVIR